MICHFISPHNCCYPPQPVEIYWSEASDNVCWGDYVKAQGFRQKAAVIRRNPCFVLYVFYLACDDRESANIQREGGEVAGISIQLAYLVCFSSWKCANRFNLTYCALAEELVGLHKARLTASFRLLLILLFGFNLHIKSSTRMSGHHYYFLWRPPVATLNRQYVIWPPGGGVSNNLLTGYSESDGDLKFCLQAIQTKFCE